MGDEDVTPRESPLPKLKRQHATTEMWMTVATALSAIATAVGGKVTGSGSLVAGLFSVVVTAVTYAALRTPLAAKRSGWKTPLFWTSMLSILGSVSLAVSEADIPGLPPGVTKICAIVASGLAASGYTVYRYVRKTS
jgi:hypothetical protein